MYTTSVNTHFLSNVIYSHIQCRAFKLQSVHDNASETSQSSIVGTYLYYLDFFSIRILKRQLFHWLLHVRESICLCT